MKTLWHIFAASAGPLALLTGVSALAQTNRPIYTDNLVNNFSKSTHSVTFNVANTSPVHSGSYSISATITASGGYVGFSHAAFNSSPYNAVSFWANGGTSGGQALNVFGTLNNSPQTAYALPALTTGWQQFIVPLSSLGCANKANFTGFRIETASGALAAFYVDDVYLAAAPAPALVHLNINVNQTNRLVDSRWFGVNTAYWDSYLGSSSTIPAMRNAGITTLRWPGGSGSDDWFWDEEISDEKTFESVATNLGRNSQVYVTVNYGSGTSNLAAGYVMFHNITNHCGFKYWEIGNECYGTWETDDNTNNGEFPHDPYTYAVRAAGYMAMMRAADPTIKIGVVASPGDDAYANGYSIHPAYNPRTKTYHNGWVPVMLTTLKSLGAQPDFLIHHVYPQSTSEPLPASPPPPACVDSDPFILQYSAAGWASDAATYEQEISDYWGVGTTNIELCVTENNSDSSLGGKQLSSLVNGLYEADAMAQLMQTPFNSYLWWDFRNGEGTTGELDPSLYGWREYGDEGMITGATGYNTVYFGMKMMQYFARPGDAILNATSDYLLLSAYAAQQPDGAVKVLVINKDPVASFTGQINLSGFTPAANAVVYSYGETQDNAAEQGMPESAQDIAISTVSGVTNLLTYSFPPYSITALTFPPSQQVSFEPSGTNFVLTWSHGTLWQAAQLTGPWTAAPASSPYTVYPTNGQMFFTVASVANPISINFTGTGTLMGGSESAGAVAETNWNNAEQSGGIGMELYDSTGAATEATVTWSAHATGATSVPNNPGDDRMMRNYVTTGSATTTTVSVAGLPPNTGGWNVYVYYDADPAQRTEGTYAISGAGITPASVIGYDTAGTEFGGVYTEANDSAGNYVVLSIPDVLGFTLTATPVSNGAANPRAPINGIQIVPQ